MVACAAIARRTASGTAFAWLSACRTHAGVRHDRQDHPTDRTPHGAARRGAVGWRIGGAGTCSPIGRLAAGQLTVADNGGPYGPAFRKAFYDPFEKATGIKVVNVVHPSEPTAQFRSLVETKSYIWDVALLSPGHVWRLVKPKNYLEPLGITKADAPGIMPDMIWPGYLGMDVFATTMAYRTDKYGDKGPQSWADFWDVKKFPGRRALYKNPNGPIEIALMADGVEPAKLYPLDHRSRLEKPRQAPHACQRVVDQRRTVHATAAKRRGGHADDLERPRTDGDRCGHSGEDHLEPGAVQLGRMVDPAWLAARRTRQEVRQVLHRSQAPGDVHGRSGLRSDQPEGLRPHRAEAGGPAADLSGQPEADACVRR